MERENREESKYDMGKRGRKERNAERKKARLEESVGQAGERVRRGEGKRE